MARLFDRLNQELEVFGRRAQAALDEGKVQIELLRLRRRHDAAARDLGLLVYRRERGEPVEPRRLDALMLRLDDIRAEIARLESRERPAAAGREPVPAPASAEPPPAEPTARSD